MFVRLTKQLLQTIGHERAVYGSALGKLAKQMLGSKFQGILNAAQRPRPVPGTCCIQNTQPKAPGEHWIGVGVYRDARGQARTLGFDTYGRNKALEAQRMIDVDAWTDKDVHQTKDSAVCGAMALAWCIIFVRRGRKAAAQV